jgi:hypothetical protein
MAMKKKGMDSECCGECCNSGCDWMSCMSCAGGKVCGWYFLVWGAILLAYGLGYFQLVDMLKGVSVWSVVGLGIALTGLMAIIHPMVCK